MAPQEITINFTDIIHNEHFNKLAIIINIPFHSQKWRGAHPQVPFWTLWEKFNKVTPIDAAFNRTEVIAAFTDLITRVAEADSCLFYSQDDLDWFFEMLDDREGPVVALFKAWVAAVHDFVTPAQIAAATNTGASTWRNRAAGQSTNQPLPGGRKVGKTWLIPLALLQSQGVLPWDFKPRDDV